VDKTVGGGRNTRDGWRWTLEGLAQSTIRRADVAIREREPQGRCTRAETARECRAVVGADSKWKHFSEAESLSEDEATWATKKRTVLGEKNPQHPSEIDEGAMGSGESNEPQWPSTYEHSVRPGTLEGSVGRRFKTSSDLKVSKGPEKHRDRA